MGRPRKQTEEAVPELRPATTAEEQENRMISLAVSLAEKQLRDGTATTPVISHYLRLATVKEKRELEKLSLENELLKARTEQIGSSARSEQLYEQAINAFRKYSGADEILD